MPATPAIKTDLRNEILRILREDITFQVQVNDLNPMIEPTAIVFQKTQASVNRSDMQSNQTTDIPGLLLCQPYNTGIRPEEWTNERDEWHYHWLVQIIDADLWDSQDRQDTWDKWEEQIISAFMFNCLPNSDVVLPRGAVICSTATGVKDIDEKRWVRDDKFISGVEIEVRVSQPRGIIE